MFCFSSDFRDLIATRDMITKFLCHIVASRYRSTIFIERPHDDLVVHTSSLKIRDEPKSNGHQTVSRERF